MAKRIQPSGVRKFGERKLYFTSDFAQYSSAKRMAEAGRRQGAHVRIVPKRGGWAVYSDKDILGWGASGKRWSRDGSHKR